MLIITLVQAQLFVEKKSDYSWGFYISYVVPNTLIIRKSPSRVIKQADWKLIYNYN